MVRAFQGIHALRQSISGTIEDYEDMLPRFRDTGVFSDSDVFKYLRPVPDQIAYSIPIWTHGMDSPEARKDNEPRAWHLPFISRRPRDQ
jgi:hypothetical protein